MVLSIKLGLNLKNSDVATLPILKIGQFLPVTIEIGYHQETLEKMQNYISDYLQLKSL